MLAVYYVIIEWAVGGPYEALRGFTRPRTRSARENKGIIFSSYDYNTRLVFFGTFSSLSPVKRQEIPVQSSLSSLFSATMYLVGFIRMPLSSCGASESSAWVTSSFIIFSFSSLIVRE